MKTWILRAVASLALKNALSYAHTVAVLTVDALHGVLDAGNLPPEHRIKIEAAIQAVSSVRDFLGRMKEIFGAPVMPVAYGTHGDINAKLQDAVKNLNRFAGDL
ncbi:MAG TPA: hypothetical protein PKE26_11025 [Kiritimatiellia bacterium]|nr:hypothetical protein [Kiritimatiellia bacterium]HMO99631.1 hypothetical protein [Kiritimatiellia bacterium]HMP97122.1 hypothetical protein [Kiritimatiellia bacterium]